MPTDKPKEAPEEAAPKPAGGLEALVHELADLLRKAIARIKELEAKAHTH